MLLRRPGIVPWDPGTHSRACSSQGVADCVALGERSDDRQPGWQASAGLAQNSPVEQPCLGI
jgi:hypothetical protein